MMLVMIHALAAGEAISEAIETTAIDTHNADGWFL